MTLQSSAELLTLHGVRLLGFGSTHEVATRFGLDHTETTEALEDARASGWLVHTSFADASGWSLTDAGRLVAEARLAAEVDTAGLRGAVASCYERFLPLNARLLRACTDWQLRPSGAGRLTANNHADEEWDGRVLDELDLLAGELSPIAAELEMMLARFGGYADRFVAAVRRAQQGDAGWVDRTDRDSCHKVWFQLHEDLIATLGLRRG